MNRREKYLQRCLELADRGRSWTHPNPMVGCVIVRDGKIVGEGWHRRFGGSHAEVLALRSAGRKARGATMYVNLEPCSHTGKTPPCVDAIIGAGIATVVAGSIDPNPFVSGRGFRRLRAAGVRVVQGVLKKEGRRLNEKFYSFMETGLPFAAIKLAQTLDGQIADWKGTSKWITSKAAREFGHQLRSEYDAVLVGANTVAKDNPELTVRLAKGKNPVRVVLDGSLSIPLSSKVCSTRKAPTIVLTTLRSMKSKSKKVVQLERRGVQVMGIDSGKSLLEPLSVLKVLGGEGLSSLLIEGGSETIRHFLEGKRGRKIYCFIAPKLLGSGIKGIDLRRRRLSRVIEVTKPVVKRLGNDTVIEGFLKY